MSIRERTQRRLFNRVLKRYLRRGTDEERQLVQDAIDLGWDDDVYQLALDKFVAETDGNVIAYDDDSQTPILDTLIDFFKWLWESGALMELIKLLIGGGLSAEEEREFNISAKLG